MDVYMIKIFFKGMSPGSLNKPQWAAHIPMGMGSTKIELQ